jgi:phosphoribosyl-AMP cyclohydrolase
VFQLTRRIRPLTCVATDAATRVLMVAHMNDEALRKTIVSARPVLQPFRQGVVAKGRIVRSSSAWSDADGL